MSIPHLILPSFAKFPTEAAIIGRLLAGYGELELDLCNCLAVALKGDAAQSLQILFSKRGEEKRIDAAHKTMRDAYRHAKLEPTYTDTIAHMHWCRKIRNQYSHCHWADDPLGLYCVLVETAIKGNALEADKLGIDVPLLEAQEQFFKEVMHCLWYLSLELQRLQGRWSSPPLPIPPKVPMPLLYNPRLSPRPHATD